MKNINILSKFPKIIFFYSLTSFLVLILTELTLSTFKEKPRYYKIERNIVLREHAPNKFERVIKFEQGRGKKISFFETDLSTDKNGYINPSIIHTKDSTNILFLGGSTTENKHVDQYKRFPYLVGRILDSKIKKMNFNSINAAGAGSHSIHSLNTFLNKGIWVPKKPEVVVLMHAINDLTTLAYNGSYYIVDKPRAIIVSKDISKFDRRIVSFQIKNYFPYLSERLITLMRRINFNSSTDEFKDYRGKEIEVNTNLMKKLFKSSLNNFVESAKSWNVKPVLMTQPNLYLSQNKYGIDKANNLEIVKTTNLNYVEFKELYDDFNQIIRNLANEKNIFLIDLEKLIPKERTLFQSDIHLNNKGSSLAAKKISNELINIFVD